MIQTRPFFTVQSSANYSEIVSSSPIPFFKKLTKEFSQSKGEQLQLANSE